MKNLKMCYADVTHFISVVREVGSGSHTKKDPEIEKIGWQVTL
jgi:hypothetical protein